MAVVMSSSARMGYVVSWDGRVVVVVVHSRTFDEGSWRRSSRGDTAGCLMLVKLRSVEALDAVGQSSGAAEVGRGVGCSWTVVVGSWGRSSRCGKPKSVAGKSMSWFWHFVGMVESWLLARNSESLRELVVAMLG